MEDIDLTQQEKNAFSTFYSRIQNTVFHEKKSMHTQVMKSELTELKNCINSITNKNKNEIITRLRSLIKENKKIINNDRLVMETIFNNFTVNSFYCKEYAEIYLILCELEPDLFVILKDAVENISEKYYNRITIADPEENYTLFCENNKTNDLIKSFTYFVGSLFTFTSNYKPLNDIVNVNYLLVVINSLIDKITQTNNYMEAYEYLENINIFVKSVPQLCNGRDMQFNPIIEKIELMKNKKGPYVYLKNKCIFKCMDILEIINV